MGTQEGAGGASGHFVFDAGALIAFERGAQSVRAIAEQSAVLGASVVIPASALAQVWRGGPRSARLARLIEGCDSDSLDERRAKEIGERLGARDASDIADAHVVCCALERRASLVTSDPADMKVLTAADEHLTVVPVQ